MARTVTELLELTKAALLEEARGLHVSGAGGMNKVELATAIAAVEAIEGITTTSAPAVQAAQPEGREHELLADIRTALKAGAKKAVVNESDEALQKLVEGQLTPAERGRVMWGGSSAKHIVG